MADLQLAPPRERSPLTSVLIAAAVLGAIAAAIFIFIPSHTSRLTVTSSQFFAPRTEFKPAQTKSGSMNIVGQDPTVEDDLYVVANVHLVNQFNVPLGVTGVTATLTLADGTTPEGAVVNRADIARLGTIFPQLAPLTPHPVGFGDDVEPGKPLDGQVVLQFPGVNATGWQTRKSATLTLTIHNQPGATATIP